MKRALTAAAMLATALATAVPALASEPGGPGPGPKDLGLDSIAVSSATLEKKTKRVVVEGTVSCSEPLRVSLHSAVRQDVGRSSRLVEASGGSEILCDGETPFRFAVASERGRLRAGGADVFAAAFAGDLAGGFDAAEVGPVRTILATPR